MAAHVKRQQALVFHAFNCGGVDVVNIEHHVFWQQPEIRDLVAHFEHDDRS